MTLIEMLLALTLSLFMLSMIFQLYEVAENSRASQEALIDIEENANAVSDILQRAVHESRYFGCAKLTDDFPFVNHLSFKLNQHNKIEEYHDAAIKVGTDAIHFWHSSIRNTALIKTMRGYSELYVNKNKSLPLSENDNVILSDCKTAEAFQIRQVVPIDKNTIKIISKIPLSKFYPVHSEVNKLDVQAYFVGLTKRMDKDHHPISALFLKNNAGKKQELVENISNMKIYFSQIENNRLIEHALNELTDSSDIKNISFIIDLTSNTGLDLHKKRYVYVALS